jgi:hypothetical protein
MMNKEIARFSNDTQACILERQVVPVLDIRV